MVHWDRCSAEIVEYNDDIDAIMDTDSRTMYPPAREVPGLNRAYAEDHFSKAISDRRLEHFGAQFVPQNVAGTISLMHSPYLINAHSLKRDAVGPLGVVINTKDGESPFSTPRKLDRPSFANDRPGPASSSCTAFTLQDGSLQDQLWRTFLIFLASRPSG